MSRNPIARQRGASIVLFTLALFALMAFMALAIDGGNLYVARAELQNAADAGALAGARVLYNDDGAMINDDASAGYDPTARAAATANFSQGTEAEVLSVKRGHWSFGTRTFTELNRLDVCDLERSAAAIDADNSQATGCVNAVEVVTQRSDTPVQAFFGRVIGLNDYIVGARAVAYIGYAGSLARSEADQPIAICKQALQAAEGGQFCSIGRFIPSSDTTVYGETGGYTDFEQEGACEGGTNTDAIRDVVCASGNPKTLFFGDPLATMGGQSDTTFADIFDCWMSHTTTKWFDADGNEIAPTYDADGNLVEPSGPGDVELATSLWNMTLPVVDCPNKDANLGPCNELVGAVNINVAWVVHQANKIDADAPREMQYTYVDADSGEIVVDTWLAPEPPEACVKNRDKDGNVSSWWADCRGEARWDAFVTQFNIRGPDDQLATIANGGWNQKTIYFLPDCSPHHPTGRTGGENFGVMSRIPVLVD